MTLRAHIFTNINPAMFWRLSRDFSRNVQGVNMSIGMDIPNDIDVLIVYGRASYSIPTTLPASRTIFMASEPDVIHRYKRQFLNQFGQVLTTSDADLTTHKLFENYCALPFVGVNFADMEKSRNLFSLRDIPSADKNDKISIVTSNKAHTEFHKARLAFLEAIKEKIPEHIVVYGRGFKSIDDKADALLPHKYHIALENGGGDFTWTEKLSDPLICRTLPFYHGCPNVADDLPAGAIDRIDITDVDAVINQMMAARRDDLWAKRLPQIEAARELIFTKFNIMNKFAELTHRAVALPTVHTPEKMRLIRSERSFWPEPGCRGSIGETLLRRGLLAVDPKIELRASKLHKKIEARRIARRKAKFAKIESTDD